MSGNPPGVRGSGSWVKEGRRRLFRQTRSGGSMYFYDEGGDLVRVQRGGKRFGVELDEAEEDQ